MTGHATSAPALSERQRLAAFGAVACATVVAATDAIAISVALLAIAADFGANAAATTWLVAAPQVVIVTMLPLFATVADIRAKISGSGSRASSPGYQRWITVPASSGLPSAQTRPIPVITPSHKATAKLAK